MKTLLHGAILAAAALAAIRAGAEDLLLKGATVHTVSGETFSPGDVLLRDGKIAVVGTPFDASGAKVVDLSGLHLYPGLIAPTSSLGLTEIGAVRATNDTNEVGDFAPDVEALIAVNPDSELIPVARANGITHALVLPMGGTLPGRSSLIRMAGWTWEDMAAAPGGTHLFWPGQDLDLRPAGESRRRGAGEWTPPEKQAEDRRARLKAVADFFEEARAYERARAAGTIPDGKKVPAWEALMPLFRGEIPLVIHADEARQIRTALEWAEKAGLRRLILAGGRDADRCADLLKRLEVPVIFERTFDQPARDTEAVDVHFTAPARLHAAGVKLAFSVGAGNWAAWGARNLPYHAAQAAAYGLPRDVALRAITLTPAEILGVADRLGSIAPGREASLIAVDGDILDIRASVRRMWIRGEEVKLESRHTRLWEKYGARPRGK